MAEGHEQYDIWDRIEHGLYCILQALIHYFTPSWETPVTRHYTAIEPESSFLKTFGPRTAKTPIRVSIGDLAMIAVIVIGIGFVFFVNPYLALISVIMVACLYLKLTYLGSYARYYMTKYPKCGAEYSYRQDPHVSVTIIPGGDGIEKHMTRTYRCSKCGYERNVESKTLMVDPAIRV